MGFYKIVTDKKPTKFLKTRSGCSKVLTLLYRALYSDYELSDDDLKYIINYVMEEYTR